MALGMVTSVWIACSAALQDHQDLPKDGTWEVRRGC